MFISFSVMCLSEGFFFFFTLFSTQSVFSICRVFSFNSRKYSVTIILNLASLLFHPFLWELVSWYVLILLNRYSVLLSSFIVVMILSMYAVFKVNIHCHCPSSQFSLSVLPRVYPINWHFSNFKNIFYCQNFQLDLVFLYFDFLFIFVDIISFLLFEDFINLYFKVFLKLLYHF